MVTEHFLVYNKFCSVICFGRQLFGLTHIWQFSKVRDKDYERKSHEAAYKEKSKYGGHDSGYYGDNSYKNGQNGNHYGANQYGANQYGNHHNLQYHNNGY